MAQRAACPRGVGGWEQRKPWLCSIHPWLQQGAAAHRSSGVKSCPATLCFPTSKVRVRMGGIKLNQRSGSVSVPRHARRIAALLCVLSDNSSTRWLGLACGTICKKKNKLKNQKNKKQEPGKCSFRCLGLFSPSDALAAMQLILQRAPQNV